METPNEPYLATERTRIRRLPDRATYDRATVHAILDAGRVAHVGFAVDGAPRVIPMAYVRDGETILLHGSTRAGVLGALAGGAPVCVTVTLLDGLVLARSAFHHSVNYRSVAVLGRGTAVTEEGAKRRALEVFLERFVPGRSAEVRGASSQELKATLVVAVPIEEVVAKRREGGPLDDAEDMALPVWAGVVPIAATAGEPIPCAALPAGTAVPEYVRRLRG
jgi:nitroimidazol reductase NimA-like FMN-containing flavoprotein (pyridoxamine 5'-phosphate oxidase superfamily)